MLLKSWNNFAKDASFLQALNKSSFSIFSCNVFMCWSLLLFTEELEKGNVSKLQIIQASEDT